MYLTERLLGVFFYASLLLAVCYLIIRLESKNTRFLLIFYLLSLSTMAFLFVPSPEADLSRLTEYMLNYASMSPESFSTALASSNTPAALVYFRLIGFLGLVGLLPAITALLSFGNIFYIIINYSKKIQAGGKAIALSLFVVMSTGLYIQTISGIRNMLAFSILARCFYDELCNDKKLWKNIAWYALACLVHPAGLAAVSLRLIAYLQYKINTRKIRALFLSIISLLAAAYSLYSFGGSAYFDSTVDKLLSYTSSVGYTYAWDTAITVISLVFIALNYILYFHYRKRVNGSKLNELVALSYFLTIFSLMFFFEHSIFVRFTQLNIITIIPLIISNLSALKNSDLEQNSFSIIIRKAVLYTPFIILAISATRGSLSSLKFFILD